MNRTRIIATAITMIGLTATAIIIATGGSRSYSATPNQRPISITRYFSSGPGASCDGDACGLGAVRVKLGVPSGSNPYRGLMTVSFQYRTSGHGRFALDASATHGNARRQPLTPGGRALAATRRWQSATLVFRTPELAAGVTHVLDIGASVARGRHARIATSKLLVQLAVAPSAGSS